MIDNSISKSLRQAPTSSYRPAPMNWRERGVGIACIIFGLVWVVAALLFLSAGRYYGLDQWLTSRLGRLGFLASGSLRRSRK